MAEKKAKITDFIQDDHNFNKGTDDGAELMKKSFSELGAGRSILVDKNNRIIAGNKSQLAAIETGIENARVIETDGTELVVVKRTDVDLDSAKGRKLALADNTTNKINLDIDEEEIEAMTKELDDFDAEEWGVELPNYDNIDDLFEDAEENHDDNKSVKIVVTVPSIYQDRYDELVTNIKEACVNYNGIKIK